MTVQNDSDMHHEHADERSAIEPELMSISHALDLLGADVRRNSPSDLEDRIFLLTRTSFARPGRNSDSTTVIKQIKWATPMRLAACAAIGVVLVGFYFGFNRGTGPANVRSGAGLVAEADVQNAEDALDQALDATLVWNGELSDDFSDLFVDLADLESDSANSPGGGWWLTDEESM